MFLCNVRLLPLFNFSTVSVPCSTRLRSVSFDESTFQLIYILIVLATSNNLLILWALIARSCVSYFFSYTLFTPFGGIKWPISSAIFLATPVFNYLPHSYVTISFNAVSWPTTILHFCLHLVEKKSRYSVIIPWSPCIYCTIFAMGFNGIQSGGSWNDS